MFFRSRNWWMVFFLSSSPTVIHHHLQVIAVSTYFTHPCSYIHRSCLPHTSQCPPSHFGHPVTLWVSLFIHWRLWRLVLSAPPTYFLSTSMMMPILHFCSSSLLTSTSVNFCAYYITHPFSWSCTGLFLFNKKFTPLKSQMQALFFSLIPYSHISSPHMQSLTQTTTWPTILWFFRLFHSQFL